MNKSPRDLFGLPPHQQALQARCFHPTSPFIEFRKEEVEQSIPERFEDQVRRHSQRLAIKTKDQELTYYELNAAANRLAHRILEKLGEPPSVVPLCVSQTPALAVAILGILKAGKHYVPFDSAQPRDWIQGVLRELDVRTVVTSKEELPKVRSWVSSEIDLCLVDDDSIDGSDENPQFSQSPDALAYIYFTSGSTGRPKGVLDTHRNVLHNIMRYTNSLHISAEDRLTLLQTLSFSGSVSNIFGALLNGASAFPFDLRKDGASRLAELLQRERITIYHSVPSIFRLVASQGKRFPDLRLIRLEGDRALPEDVNTYRRSFSKDCLLANGLGATECGLVRQFFMDRETALPGEVVPVGYAVPDMEIVLLDDHGEITSGTEVGEIAVRSAYLSPGYWHRPELTQRAFTAESGHYGVRLYRTGDLGRFLSNECLLHLGRRDAMVKVRGASVYPEEIERALAGSPDVREAVVLPREDAHGEVSLTAYVVSASGRRARPTELREYLTPRLGVAKVPSQFRVLDELPLTRHGKVDRGALSQTGKARPDLDMCIAPPRTSIEEKIAQIWAEALHVDEVGIHHRFLDLGGDSLIAARVISRILSEFKVELPLRSLFDTPTVAGMAAVLAQNELTLADPSEVERVLSEAGPPSEK